jgi:hypothetical protein
MLVSAVWAPIAFGLWLPLQWDGRPPRGKPVVPPPPAAGGEGRGEARLSGVVHPRSPAPGNLGAGLPQVMEDGSQVPSSGEVWQANAPLTLSAFVDGAGGAGGTSMEPLVALLLALSLLFAVGMLAAMHCWLIATGNTTLEVAGEHSG